MSQIENGGSDECYCQKFNGFDDLANYDTNHVWWASCYIDFNDKAPAEAVVNETSAADECLTEWV